jgi:hypothetical protein
MSVKPKFKIEDRVTTHVGLEVYEVVEVHDDGEMTIIYAWLAKAARLIASRMRVQQDSFRKYERTEAA